jgi:hypothetical protein
MQSGQRIGDMIVSTEAKRQTSCGIKDRLEQTQAVSRRSNEDEISVVEPRMYERHHQRTKTVVIRITPD